MFGAQTPGQLDPVKLCAAAKGLFSVDAWHKDPQNPATYLCYGVSGDAEGSLMVSLWVMGTDAGPRRMQVDVRLYGTPVAMDKANKTLQPFVRAFYAAGGQSPPLALLDAMGSFRTGTFVTSLGQAKLSYDQEDEHKLYIIGIVLPAPPAGPTRDENLKRCADADPDVSIAACTALIQSGLETPANLAIEFYNRGVAYGGRDSDRAIADFDQAISRDPKMTDAYYGRGLEYSRKADVDRALLDLDRALALNPNHKEALTRRALVHIKRANYTLAIKDLDRALTLDPSDLSGYFERGETYHLLGQYDRAIADYSESLRLDPKNPFALYGRGVAKQMIGDSAAGDADIAAGVKAFPNVAAMMASDGIISAHDANLKRCQAQSDSAAAIAGCTALIENTAETSKTRAVAYYNRGQVYNSSGDRPHALADYSQAIAADPQYAPPLLARAGFYLTDERYDSALADLDRAIALDPKSDAGFFRRGIIDFKRGQYDRAVADFTTAHSLSQYDTIGQFCGGVAKQMIGDWVGGEGDMIAATRQVPGLASSAEYWGIIPRIPPPSAVPATTLADENWKQCFVYRPLRIPACTALAEAETARAAADRTGRGPGNAARNLEPIYLARAIAYRDRAQYDLAITDLTKVISLRSTSSTLFERGVTYHKKGDWQSAIADYTAAIAIYPKYSLALFGRGVARQMLGDAAGGNADIAAATALTATIATTMAKYGIAPKVPMPKAPVAPGPTAPTPPGAVPSTRDNNWARCSGTEPESRLAGCTALIQLGQETGARLRRARPQECRSALRPRRRQAVHGR